MLPRPNRMTRTRDFELLFPHGRFAGGAFVTLKFWRFVPDFQPRRQINSTDLKIGILVSKKVSKRAVVRNRLKRQVREVVRLLLKEGQIPIGYLLVFSIKAEAKDQEYQTLATDVRNVLVRARLIA